MKISEEIKKRLVEQAILAMEKAYTPYSGYLVGASLLSSDGEIFNAGNVENAVYPLTICAERSAVVKAVSEGKKEFSAIAVATRDGGTPCGSCRQVLAEFGLKTLVIIASKKGEILQEITVEDLLPYSFGPANLDTRE
jgi:cytidine deaminase